MDPKEKQDLIDEFVLMGRCIAMDEGRVARGECTAESVAYFISENTRRYWVLHGILFPGGEGDTATNEYDK